jgi:hypothetical protein
VSDSVFKKKDKPMTIKPVEVHHVEAAPGDPPIAKPEKFSLSKFKSSRAATIANVTVLQSALPVHSLAAAKDFVKLHHEQWTDELCFVSVPIKGAPRDTMHLILEDLAVQHLPSARIIRHRLALATKPLDKFFLCAVPSQNLDNSWVASNLQACDQAKEKWTQATSRKDEGVESYLIKVAFDTDAFPEPNWPQQSIEELIEITFNGRMIDSADHPGLLRLMGRKVT